MHRRDHLELGLERDRPEHIVAVDLDVLEPLRTPLCSKPARQIVVARRAGGVRLACQFAVETPRAIGRRQRTELFLERALLRRMRLGVTAHRWCGRRLLRQADGRECSKRGSTRDAHYSSPIASLYSRWKWWTPFSCFTL